MSVKDSKKISLSNAVNRLEEAVSQQKPKGVIGEMMRDAIIQRFEFTLEAAWKYMRFVLIDEGVLKEDVASPKKAVQLAFCNGLIKNGDVWLEMIRYRNMLSHTYNEVEAVVLEEKIKNEYLREFKALLENTQISP